MKRTAGRAWKWILASFFFPFYMAFAQVRGGTPSSAPELKNPIKLKSISELLNAFLDIVIFLGTYAAVIFLLWSGFLFVKAQGNSTELETAKKTFFYTVIGVAILLGAKALSIALEATIKSVVQ